MSQSTSSFTGGGSTAGSTTGSVLGLQMPTISDGSVLGAVTPAVAGTAILPVTGNNPLIMALVITSIAIATLVIISFIVTRILKRFILK